MKHDAITAAALRRLEQQATEIEARRQQAYFAGRAAAHSSMFWTGALFGALIGAGLVLAYLPRVL
ncbi:hypothetical protein [Methylibium petroleiphilum]